MATAAFALTLVPGFRLSERSLLSVRGRGTALLVFLLLGLVEDATVRHTGWFNHRIVVVCAASLLAGLGVGVVVRLFVISLAITRRQKRDDHDRDCDAKRTLQPALLFEEEVGHNC
jgi:hypothetical protein